MRTLHLEKQGLRCLAIAESFGPNSEKSVLSGLVMSRNFLIDGFVFGSATLRGDDATETILKMYYELERSDINYVLISGLIISLYNIIDIKKLHSALKIPVIGVTYYKSSGIGDALKRHFPDTFKPKIREYEKLGIPEKITLKTSHDVFVRKEGCSTNDVQKILDNLTLQGSHPEPLRISQLLARTLLQKGLSF